MLNGHRHAVYRPPTVGRVARKVTRATAEVVAKNNDFETYEQWEQSIRAKDPLPLWFYDSGSREQEYIHHIRTRLHEKLGEVPTPDWL